ncbi:hypothetical protein LA345_37420 (plasmid) [Burkholderia vietnamiensis]|uniref:Uncharacterized protein n=1 Tax=Burkholderia vietnamiensis (strain G4 / LMG 22486) TaxID=269482 RepID=A4JVK7_BURVG|nr:hypothetical protein Bcep1808_7433 [Burkholderia vietnamiensis G4]MCB4349497.1 hypothetical protein [Burkholderia vietnamiensis]
MKSTAITLLTRDEVAMALAALGEDPTLGRTDAVRSLIVRTSLSGGDREKLIRQAADVARRKLDRLLSGDSVFPADVFVREAQVEARLREHGWRSSRMGGPADDRGNYVAKTGNNAGSFIGLFSSGNHNGAEKLYPIAMTDEEIAGAIIEHVRQVELSRSASGRLLATVVEFVNQHPEWWAEQGQKHGFALVPWIVDARSADSYSKATHSLREWVRLIDAGHLDWHAGDDWEGATLEQARDELVRLDRIHSEVAFVIGAMPRDQLEEIAADNQVDFDKHATDSELRAELIEVVAQRRSHEQVRDGAAPTQVNGAGEPPAVDMAERIVVPIAVEGRVKIALNTLRRHELSLQNVLAVRGAGHFLALTLRESYEAIQQARGTLKEFRRLAPQNNVDAEAFIKQCGGEPDFSVFGEPALPVGWTEATPGGLATNRDPDVGGIVDSEIGSGLWFAIANRDGIPTLDGYGTRQAAFDALHEAINEATRVQRAGAMPSPSSGDLAAKYPARGSMPARVVEQLYITREAEYALLAKRERIDVSDLASLDRGARFMVADGLFDKCSGDARAALLTDASHGVRSTARLAGLELGSIEHAPASDTGPSI